MVLVGHSNDFSPITVNNANIDSQLQSYSVSSKKKVPTGVGHFTGSSSDTTYDSVGLPIYFLQRHLAIVTELIVSHSFYWWLEGFIIGVRGIRVARIHQYI